MAHLSLPLCDSSHLQIAFFFFPNLTQSSIQQLGWECLTFWRHTPMGRLHRSRNKKREAYFKRSFVMGRDEGLCKMIVLKAHLLVLSVRDRQSCEIISITLSHSHF